MSMSTLIKKTALRRTPRQAHLIKRKLRRSRTRGLDVNTAPPRQAHLIKGVLRRSRTRGHNTAPPRQAHQIKGVLRRSRTRGHNTAPQAPRATAVQRTSFVYVNETVMHVTPWCVSLP